MCTAARSLLASTSSSTATPGSAPCGGPVHGGAGSGSGSGCGAGRSKNSSDTRSLYISPGAIPAPASEAIVSIDGADLLGALVGRPLEAMSARSGDAFVASRPRPAWCFTSGPLIRCDGVRRLRWTALRRRSYAGATVSCPGCRSRGVLSTAAGARAAEGAAVGGRGGGQPGGEVSAECGGAAEAAALCDLLDR